MSEIKQKKRFQLPHVYTIAFMLIILFAVLTWIIPSGQFERQTISTAAGERDVAVAGTYQEVSKVDEEGGDLRQGIASVLMAPTRGIQAAGDVVAFVLLIGGTFAIVTKTNAINAGMSRVIRRLKNKDILIIPIVMLLLSIGGTTFGMSEEALPFYAIFMPIMMGLGYDSMTAFMICFMGPQVGYCASTVNPFNVLIAQGIAGIEGNPQLWFRFIQWGIFTVLGIAWVMLYARRVKKSPESSITYQDDIIKRQEFSVNDSDIDIPFTGRQKLVLLIFAAGMGLIVWGLVTNGWYMDEISMVFLAIGGAPLGFFYEAVNTMDSMLGYIEPPYRDFGFVPAKMDDVMNYLPARLSGLLMLAAGTLLGMDARNGWRIFRRDRYNHASPNSAQTESVCAGLLGLRLAGDAWYHGALHKKPYIGDPLREVEPEDIPRACRLLYGTAFLSLALCALARLAAGMLLL